MKQYQDLLQHILDNGVEKSDRTGTGTISTFGYQMRFDLSKGFPLVTTKRVAFRLVASELLWFLRGDTNIKYLLENNNHIWTDWAYKAYKESRRLFQGESMEEFEEKILTDSYFCAMWGDLGEVYGSQWRYWDGYIDQISEVIESITNNPDSRRHIVTAWNPSEINRMTLPPCHAFFQFYVVNGKLSCQLYQRSADVFLGVPFNIASYALLTHMVAHVTGLEVGEFVHTLGDAHIYLNHVDQVKLQLTREPKPLPTIILNQDITSIFDFKMDDIQLLDYNPHPAIKGDVSV